MQAAFLMAAPGDGKKWQTTTRMSGTGKLSTVDIRPHALVQNARRSARKYEALMSSLSIEEGKQGKKPNDAKRKRKGCSGMYSLPLW
jgi:hypothetical protein